MRLELGYFKALGVFGIKKPFTFNLFVFLSLFGNIASISAVNKNGKDKVSKFTFTSGVPSYDVAYNLALSEMQSNIDQKNGTFIAGSGWTQLWTRDTSFAIELSAGLLHPETSKASLELCTEIDINIGTVWLQDECGHFGGWPNLSDAIVGASGSWSLFLTTGDESFLSWAYEITKNSLARAERDVYNSETGLFMGCSSFMESNSGYPSQYAMNGTLVGQTKALSTNMLYYRGYKIAADMGAVLGASEAEIRKMIEKSENIRKAVEARLWMPNEGHFSYFEDKDGALVDQNEALGESLLLLAPKFESENSRADIIFHNTHRSGVGIPCLWPKFDLHETSDIASYYHNGRIWPFVQGFWAIAAARHKRVDIFGEEFANLVKLSQIDKSHETFAEFYELDGEYQKIRSRQLWSDSGFLGMVFHGLFGINLGVDGIWISPSKPEWLPFSNTVSLLRIIYRDMELDIHVNGHGSEIDSFRLDGKLQVSNFVSNTLKGSHQVKIELLSNAVQG